ncbi:MAG: pyruvate kinase [Clostridia bacterium]|nr:pyruvate kinase [Clostridia bacterium]
MNNVRKTKIICTLGPATDDKNVLKSLMQEGMNVARLNFSHGTQAEQAQRIALVKECREALDLPIGILLDTRGPEVRVKTFENGKIMLNEGDTFTLTGEEVIGNEQRVSVTFPQLAQNLTVGTRVLIDDGLIGMEVIEVRGADVICKVLNGGEVKDRKSINIPGIRLNMPYINEKDREDVIFGIKNGIDFVAASFVRTADDAREMRKLLDENDGKDIEIIAKIENREGVDNALEILKICDGIMVARGDLGVEVPFYELPEIQKNLADLCLKMGKKCVTATQMLDSMIKNPRPTRAEVSDVANAVFDHTSAVMLSGETSIGKYPVETVRAMVQIVKNAESNIDYTNKHIGKLYDTNDVTSAISHATVSSAHDLDAAAIIAVTTSGYTAKMVSSYRPQTRIIGGTANRRVYYKLSLSWGVTPMMMAMKMESEPLWSAVLMKAEAMNYIKKDDLVVLTAGLPIGIPGTTNTLRIVKVD